MSCVCMEKRRRANGEFWEKGDLLREKCHTCPLGTVVLFFFSLSQCHQRGPALFRLIHPEHLVSYFWKWYLSFSFFFLIPTFSSVQGKRIKVVCWPKRPCIGPIVQRYVPSETETAAAAYEPDPWCLSDAWAWWEIDYISKEGWDLLWMGSVDLR